MFNDEGLGEAMARHYTEEKAKEALERVKALEERLNRQDAQAAAARAMLAALQDLRSYCERQAGADSDDCILWTQAARKADTALIAARAAGITPAE